MELRFDLGDINLALTQTGAGFVFTGTGTFLDLFNSRDVYFSSIPETQE